MIDTAHPAIRQKTSDRPDLLIFEITDQIHTADIERMARSVDLAIDRFNQIDILLVFATFDGATLGALVDGKAIGVSLRSNAHVRRYGVVGAPRLAEMMINIFDPLTPIDARTFEIDQIEQAHAWMDGRDVAPGRGGERASARVGSGG